MDGILVGTDGSVAAQPPEFAAVHTIVRLDERNAFKGKVGDVVVYSYCESFHGILRCEVGKYGEDLPGVGIL